MLAAGDTFRAAAIEQLRVSELADRRGLAGTVDADHQDHERLLGRVDHEG
jgi:signal recognition particle GTPase